MFATRAARSLTRAARSIPSASPLQQPTLNNSLRCHQHHQPFSSSASAPSSPPLPEIVVTKSSGAPPAAFITTPSVTSKLETLHTKLHAAEDEIHLRVTVDAGGCSGFSYAFTVGPHNDSTFNIDEDLKITPDDSASKKVHVVTDLESLPFLKGCTIDYKIEMIRSAFAVVDNPLAESACGCGSSFALKNFGATREALKD